MMIDDPLSADNIESVTLRHLRDLRRSQDLMVDLAKRQSELVGRLDRKTDEVRSDLLLLENRTITAMETDTFVRRQLGDLIPRIEAIETNILETGTFVRSQLGDLTPRIEAIETNMMEMNSKLDRLISSINPPASNKDRTK